MKKLLISGSFLFLFSSLFYGQDTVGIVLVKDVQLYEGNNYTSNNSSFPQKFTEVNGTLYFTANCNNELWKTDGTPSGTQFVKSFNSNNSYIDCLTPFGNKIIFSAYDGNCCNEPWISDGTTAGTILLTNSNPSNAVISAISPSNPYAFFDYNNKVFFSGVYDNTSQLWVTDGTNAGSKVLTRTGIGDRSPYGFFPFKDKLFFSCRSNLYNDRLWVTDGTIDSTYEFSTTANSFNNTLDDFKPCVYKDMMYYSLSTNPYGDELWRTDGTISGTSLFIDINKAGRNSNPRNLTICNSKLYFVATDDSTYNSTKLYYTDGDSIYVVKYKQDIYSISDIFVVNNKLFAKITLKYNNPNILFEVNDKTDSLVPFLSSDSTVLYHPTKLLTWNNQLLFTSDDYFKRLWITDGTMKNTHTLFPDSIIRRLPTLSGYTMCEFNNEIYFAGIQNDSIGIELYKLTRDKKILEQQTRSFVVASNSTTLFPNPCHSKIAVNFDGNKEKKHIRVVTIFGNTVFETTTSDSELSIDLQQLSNGMYIVSIESKSKNESYKIIKQ